MSKRKNKGKLPPFIAMYRHAFKSKAFAELSVFAQATLLHLIANYNSNMCNSVYLPSRIGAKKLNVSRTTLARALHELEHYGFIVKVQGAHSEIEGVGKSARYRLTDRQCGNKPATYDYEKWSGDIFEIKKTKKPKHTALMEWSMPVVTEMAWKPTTGLRFREVYIPGPVPQRFYCEEVGAQQAA